MFTAKFCKIDMKRDRAVNYYRFSVFYTDLRYKIWIMDHVPVNMDPSFIQKISVRV